MDRQVFLSLLVSWLPFIVLVIVWLFLARWMKEKGPWVRLADQQQAQVAELQRTNALLDRIAVALERRVEK